VLLVNGLLFSFFFIARTQGLLFSLQQLSRKLREMENKMRLEMEDSLADAGQLSDSGRRMDDLLRQIREDDVCTRASIHGRRETARKLQLFESYSVFGQS
jgi:hypothetical protein